MSRPYIKHATADELRQTMTYDPETGAFTRMAYGKVRTVGSTTNTGHKVIYFAGRLCKAHRLAWLYMTGEWPPSEIDHINRDPADNRWSNLRLTHRSGNVSNRLNFNRRDDLPRGVSKVGARFKATAKIHGKQTYLGYFDTPEEAHAAFLAAVMPVRGDFLPREITNAV